MSCGWPKFGNYGEFLDDTEVLDHDLDQGNQILFTHKHDGSLCIRSVIGGKVIFRTRGTLFGGDYDEDGNEPFGVRFRRTAENRYPKLLDPKWEPERSLLFEYVSPENRIVVRYKEDDLIFLGFVNHDLTVGTWTQTQVIAKDGGLSLVEVHDLPKSPELLLAEIKDWEDEGVVVRCKDSQVMVKIKSAFYRNKHYLKSNLNFNFIAEFIELANIKNEDEFVLELKKDDHDFETIEEATQIYRRYDEIFNVYEKHLAEAENLCNVFNSSVNIEDKRERKKEYAKLACAQNSIVKSMMFALYDGKTSVLNTLRRKFILSKGKE